jgi:hypothetical protein
MMHYTNAITLILAKYFVSLINTFTTDLTNKKNQKRKCVESVVTIDMGWDVGKELFNN